MNITKSFFLDRLPCLLVAVCLLGASPRLAAADPAPTHKFAIGTDDFLLDGQPFVIRCGELHSARIPPEYWRHRLKMAKALGLNTVCAYLFWNFHEWEEGKFDWSGDRDVAEFCRIAQEEGLWVIVRPGPTPVQNGKWAASLGGCSSMMISPCARGTRSLWNRRRDI